MKSGAFIALLTDGRLHLQHGPIDLIISAEARDRQEVDAALQAAAMRFDGLLEELVLELPRLREPVTDHFFPSSFAGTVARRMAHAVWPHRDVFITPMAAVAGSVADEIMAAMIERAKLTRAYVNNGGDIALYLAPGMRYRLGVVGDVALPAIDATITVSAVDGVSGVATSGWRGRSLSLGIADAVTVLATNAAMADAATKPIAMAIDAAHPNVHRARAKSVREDSDLGDLPVVVDVGPLPDSIIDMALANGVRVARTLQRQRRIHSAYLQLQGHCRIIAEAKTIDAATDIAIGVDGVTDLPTHLAHPEAML